jgi:hypothetical protein
MSSRSQLELKLIKNILYLSRIPNRKYVNSHNEWRVAMTPLLMQRFIGFWFVGLSFFPHSVYFRGLATQAGSASSPVVATAGAVAGGGLVVGAMKLASNRATRIGISNMALSKAGYMALSKAERTALRELLALNGARNMALSEAERTALRELLALNGARKAAASGVGQAERSGLYHVPKSPIESPPLAIIMPPNAARNAAHEAGEIFLYDNTGKAIEKGSTLWVAHHQRTQLLFEEVLQQIPPAQRASEQALAAALTKVSGSRGQGTLSFDASTGILKFASFNGEITSEVNAYRFVKYLTPAVGLSGIINPRQDND